MKRSTTHGSDQPPQRVGAAGAGAGASAGASAIDLKEPFPLEGVHVPEFLRELQGCVFQGDLEQHENSDERGKSHTMFYLVGPHRILRASPNGSSLFVLERLPNTPATMMTVRFRRGKVFELSYGTLSTDLNHPDVETGVAGARLTSLYGNGIILSIDHDDSVCTRYERGTVKWTNERGNLGRRPGHDEGIVVPSIVHGNHCSFTRTQFGQLSSPVTTRYGNVHCMMERRIEDDQITDSFTDPTYFAEPFDSPEDQQADLQRELMFQTRVFDDQIAGAVRRLNATQFQMNSLRSLAESANKAQSCFVHHERITLMQAQPLRKNPIPSMMDQLTHAELAQRSSTLKMLKSSSMSSLLRSKLITNTRLPPGQPQCKTPPMCCRKTSLCCQKHTFFNLAHEFEYPVRTTRVAHQQQLRSNLVLENFAKNRSLMEALSSVQFPQSAGEAELVDVMNDPSLMEALTDLANSMDVDGAMGGHGAMKDGDMDGAMGGHGAMDGDMKDGDMKDGDMKDGDMKDGAMKDGDMKDGASGGFRKRNSKKPKSRSKTKKSKTMRKRKTRRSH